MNERYRYAAKDKDGNLLMTETFPPVPEGDRKFDTNWSSALHQPFRCNGVLVPGLQKGECVEVEYLGSDELAENERPENIQIDVYRIIRYLWPSVKAYSGGYCPHCGSELK